MYTHCFWDLNRPRNSEYCDDMRLKMFLFFLSNRKSRESYKIMAQVEAHCKDTVELTVPSTLHNSKVRDAEALDITGVSLHLSGTWYMKYR